MQYETSRLHVVAAALLLILASSACKRQEENHLSFPSPEAAIEALVAAVEAQDRDRLARLLGPGSEEILDWGDPVEAKLDRIRFLKLYRSKAALVPEREGVMSLEIGEKDWPLPVPS